MPLAKQEPPWWCGNCGKQEVRPSAEPYRIEVRHDGATHQIEVRELRAPKCAACGSVVFGREEDEQINQAIRERFGLLSPEEIHRRRDALGLTKAEIAGLLDVSEETLTKWESGALIQSSVDDGRLRELFDARTRRGSVSYMG